MDTVAEAVLTDGRKLPYVICGNPPRGGMKYTYFAPDRSYVVQFFNDPAVGRDPQVRQRLEAILGRYNPTLPESEGGAKGNSPQMAAYFANSFCWPSGIVQEPECGVVCPAYPQNFFFSSGASTVLELQGRDKRSNWFTTRNRRFLELQELGDFRSMLQMSILLARSVRRLHQAGLAHSDLSCNNVLIDPPSGHCVIIDIDSLVVPGLFPPEVVGTRGYIAPEVLQSMVLPYGDPGRKQPSALTDLHALAVLLYEYLLLRHPLIGPKIHDPNSPEHDDFLALGEKALFIEHPSDHSNRPEEVELTIQDLGPELKALFLRAFVDGLHEPNLRPTAMEWEKALTRTWDLLQPCENPECAARWFVLHDPKEPRCPFCGHAVQRTNVVQLRLKSQRRSGQWTHTRTINLYNQMPLFRWHILPNVFPDEKADGHLLAYVSHTREGWLLVNHALSGMTVPGGKPVPVGQAVVLRDGVVVRMSGEERGLLAEVSMPA